MPAHGQAGGHPPVRAWTRALLVIATAAYVIATFSLLKADRGGKGMQVAMIAIAGVVLLVTLVVRRRAILAAFGVQRQKLGQHQLWLRFIRVIALGGAVLAAFGAARSKDHQMLSALMLVIDLWVLSIAIRLDNAARAAKVEGTA